MLAAIKYHTSQPESDEKKSLYQVAQMFNVFHSTLKHHIADQPSR